MKNLKPFYLLLLFSLFVKGGIFAQQDTIKRLVITDSEKDRKRSFRDNQVVKVWCGDSLTTGRFYILSDSTISINNNSISIDSITQIRLSKKLARIVGTSLLAFNGSMLTLGLILAINADDLGPVIIIVGSLWAAVVLVPIGVPMVIKKKYVLDDNLSISIKITEDN